MKMALNHWKLQVLLCVLFPLAGAIYNVIFIGQLQEYKTIAEFFANHGVDNFTSIVLLGDLTHLDTTLLIDHVHDVSISGNGSNGTHVCCRGNNSGLVFRWASNIEISRVSFLNCGSIQESTSTDFSNTSRSATLKLKSALYFHYCANISISSATFEDNRGVGVVIYDSSGTVAICDCIFRYLQTIARHLVEGVESTLKSPAVLLALQVPAIHLKVVFILIKASMRSGTARLLITTQPPYWSMSVPILPLYLAKSKLLAEVVGYMLGWEGLLQM